MKIKIYTTGGSIDKTYSTQESSFVVAEPQTVQTSGSDISPQDSG